MVLKNFINLKMIFCFEIFKNILYLLLLTYFSTTNSFLFSKSNLILLKLIFSNSSKPIKFSYPSVLFSI